MEIPEQARHGWPTVFRNFHFYLIHESPTWGLVYSTRVIRVHLNIPESEVRATWSLIKYCALANHMGF